MELGLVDIVMFHDHGLSGSDEFYLGKRELRRRLPHVRRYYELFPETAPLPVQFATWSEASWLLVIINPAILISDNLLHELVGLTSDPSVPAVCSLPSDPRSLISGQQLDYASRPGFDRFVSRLATGPRCGKYDGREPWLYLVKRQILEELQSDLQGVTWGELPARLKERTITAQHAFVHSYADYHINSRSEMMDLLPANIETLLDVGGGVGNFARTFMKERGGQATLLDANNQATEMARKHGLNALEGDFLTMRIDERYDCVALLDVLEHMANPDLALFKVKQVLLPGGFLLLSVPNVGHWSVVWDLLEGQFDYQPVGILCNTHLRFFSRKGLERFLDDAGFQVERWENVYSAIPDQFAEFINGNSESGVKLDLDSLATESFHVLAKRF